MEFTYKIYPVNQAIDVEKQIFGSNHKGILFVYNTDDKDHLDFLKKIISAIQLDFETVLSMSISGNEYVKLPNLYDDKTIDKIVVFGIEPKKLCFNAIFSKYKICQIQERNVLFADKLVEIQENKELKKNLWICLKELFGV